MVAATTYALAGTAEPRVHFVKQTFGKISGVIGKGVFCGNSNIVTPNKLKQADASTVPPYVISDWVGAASGDTTFGAYTEGLIVMEAGGAIQPGAFVKPDADGNPVAAANTDATRAGIYRHKPGEDGAIALPTAAADGDLIYVEMIQA